MILHFSHIGFTDGRTFMIPFGFGPDEVALVTRTATATMPPERTSRTDPLTGPSATKQNTKRLRRVMSRAVAASSRPAGLTTLSRVCGENVVSATLSWPLTYLFHMTGEPAFFEIGVEDQEKGRAFYGALFGWELEPGPNEGYEIATPGLPGGMHGGDTGAAPYLFFLVEDMEAAMARVREARRRDRGRGHRGRRGPAGQDRPLQALPRRPGVAVRPARAPARVATRRRRRPCSRATA